MWLQPTVDLFIWTYYKTTSPVSFSWAVNRRGRVPFWNSNHEGSLKQLSFATIVRTNVWKSPGSKIQDSNYKALSCAVLDTHKHPLQLSLDMIMQNWCKAYERAFYIKDWETLFAIFKSPLSTWYNTQKFEISGEIKLPDYLHMPEDS